MLDSILRWGVACPRLATVLFFVKPLKLELFDAFLPAVRFECEVQITKVK